MTTSTPATTSPATTAATTTAAATTTTATAAVPAAAAADARAHFAARLRFETDVSDVHADLDAAVPGLLVVDSRSPEAWETGHLPGAVHCPTAQIPRRGAELAASASLVVTYCWGPGCNGATRAALAFAELGVPVKEMLGGYEYWVREGFPVDGAAGRRVLAADPLTAPPGIACAC